MPDPVIDTVPLGFAWPAIDPFLFCVHHLDHYPEGDGRFGPRASLAGRDLGQDFAGVDGWRMYHGLTVPGFPQHPHRGFETITYARQGYIDHSDSLGAAARFGRGDVQWMTAGAGVVHSEMFPLLDTDGPNTVELFQIWLNLPPEDKMAEPCYSMLWDEDIPRVDHVDDDGVATQVTVIAGALPGVDPADLPAPPPRSWASRADADVAVWHVRIDPGGRFELPPAAGPRTHRMVYVFEGAGVEVGGHPTAAPVGVRVDASVAAPLVAGGGGAEVLVLQGRPIGAPVAQYGPFVMNTRSELVAAFEDYQRTEFGGWPWPSDDPVHGPSPERFARHADGQVATR